MRIHPFLLIAVLGMGVLSPVRDEASLQGAEPLLREAVKARYLLYFGIYVRWPDDAVPQAKGQFVIGILGRDPFGDHLQVFAGRPLNGKRIVVRRFASMEQYSSCHILFISDEAAVGRKETAKDRLDAALARVGDQPVLIVSETSGFARQGAVINFVDDQQAQLIRMEVNRTAQRRAALEISSELLDLSVVTLIE
jgi:hypothetical protein